ncbi:hypothetical protein OSS47_28435 [Pseudomonas citronellolis]|uniref:hypothetical protein n=1 Tax=Pseudomonas citronellolis TaxID=53408 RepID=UPI00227229BB|nr:hypothetical protein [Pseudomonas citronellolis]WAB91998.1 hypothetical protein OSS47_28435 [Pseudomonas citronellolis]
MHTTFRERRNRRAFASAQAAWDAQKDPLWDEPDTDDQPPDAADLEEPDVEGE